MTDILLEELDIEKIISILGDSEEFPARKYIDDLLSIGIDVLRDELFEEYDEIDEDIDLEKEVPEPKFIHILKFLSILKKENVKDIRKEDSLLLYILSFFNTYKNLQNKLTQEELNWLNSFNKLKNYEEYRNWVKKFFVKWVNDVNSEKILKIMRDKLLGDLEIPPVFENEEIEIHKVKNYVQSRKLGGDTRWCVSSPTSGEDYYIDYKEKGYDIYVLIIKETEEKYILAVHGDYEDTKIDSEIERIIELGETDIVEFVEDFWDNIDHEVKEAISEITNDPRFEALLTIVDKHKDIKYKEFSDAFFNNIIEDKAFVMNMRSYTKRHEWVNAIKDLTITAFLNTIKEVFHVTIDNFEATTQLLRTMKINRNKNLVTEIIRDNVNNMPFYNWGDDYFIDTLTPNTLLNYEIKDENNVSLSAAEEEKVMKLFGYYLSGFVRDYKNANNAKLNLKYLKDNLYNIMDKKEKEYEEQYSEVIENIKKLYNNNFIKLFIKGAEGIIDEIVVADYEQMSKLSEHFKKSLKMFMSSEPIDKLNNDLTILKEIKRIYLISNLNFLDVLIEELTKLIEEIRFNDITRSSK